MCDLGCIGLSIARPYEIKMGVHVSTCAHKTVGVRDEGELVSLSQLIPSYCCGGMLWLEGASDTDATANPLVGRWGGGGFERELRGRGRCAAPTLVPNIFGRGRAFG